MNEQIHGIYFANHFFNYYHEAPVENICNYIKELKSHGQNSICLWFDMHHYSGINDAEAQKMLKKIDDIFKFAHSIDMKTCLTVLANEYYYTGPKELRAKNSTENGLYKEKLCGFYYTEICPSVEGGEKLLLDSKREFFCALSEKPDYITLWPYDQGGCTCGKCFPWGANGFMKLAKKEAEIAREIMPNVKIILSTWYFDRFTDGEWDGFFEQSEHDRWFDVLMVDMFAKLPDKLKCMTIPIISFPEISMRNAVPWGGFGANPYPKAIKAASDNVKDFIKGGFAYSEGIFEDINKYVILSLYKNPDENVHSIIESYCRKCFGNNLTDEITDLIIGLEDTLERKPVSKSGDELPAFPEKPFEELPGFIIRNQADVKRLCELAVSIDNELAPEIKKCWRWRIIYIRAVGDYCLVKNNGFPSDESDVLFEELEKIYYAENAHYFLAPITRKSVLRENMQFV